MIRKIVEHVLIWVAASAIIVAGMSWAYTFGFSSFQLPMQVAGVAAALATVIFAGGLVQRSPLAVSGLVLVSATLFALGALLAADGDAAVGLGYMAVGAVYVGSLGPCCVRWLTARRW